MPSMKLIVTKDFNQIACELSAKGDVRVEGEAMQDLSK